MFGMWVHVIDVHVIRVIYQGSKIKCLTLSLKTEMKQAFSKIVFLWGHGVSQTHLVYYYVNSSPNNEILDKIKFNPFSDLPILSSFNSAANKDMKS